MSRTARGRPGGRARARTTPAGLAAALCLVLAGCADGGTAASSSVSGSPSLPSSASPSVSPAGSAPSTSVTPGARGEARRRPKDLRGGGYASAVPGSDDPEVTTDTGPRFALSDDVDLEEIERLVRAVERIARRTAPEQPLVDGGSVQAAVGTFSYRYFADGTVAPDPDWVAANIRTASVPVLGSVTCHKVLLVPLRAALREVVDRGLAGAINADEFGGCYVPRFIGRDPARGLSLHTWGIAVDLNVPGNLRGTRGEIDRDVVRIFQRWGFAWGGTWRYTDPMHFELARLVRPR